MRITALDHVQLAMPPGREAEARAFYGGLLGIPEVTKPPHLARRGGAWFARDDLKVHLGVEQNFTPARKAHPAFLVTDLAALIAILTESGFVPVTDRPLAGYERVYVSDPFGNRIELMEPTPARWGRNRASNITDLGPIRAGQRERRLIPSPPARLIGL